MLLLTCTILVLSLDFRLISTQFLQNNSRRSFKYTPRSLEGIVVTAIIMVIKYTIDKTRVV